MLRPEHRDRAVVVRVGAPKAWFEAGSSRPARPDDQGPDLSVVFFGLYTPLQGTTMIGEAIGKLAGERVNWTMIGTGQDRAACEVAMAFQLIESAQNAGARCTGRSSSPSSAPAPIFEKGVPIERHD